MSTNHAPTYKKNEKHTNRRRALEKVAARNARAEIERIAGEIAGTLKSLGLTVHRCASKSTPSLYLCIDYGLGNTIRISNHAGKRHLNHRYNVLLGLAEKETRHGADYERFFYPPCMLDDLYSEIGRRLSERTGSLGVRGYLEEKERLRLKHDGEGGFWEYAEEVEDDVQ